MAFGKITFEPGERILAELCPNRRSLLFPVLELLLITGVTWALIGLIDHFLDAEALRLLGYSLPVPSQLALHVNDPLYLTAQWGRRALVVLWLFLAWRRCGRQMIFRARSRMMLTNERRCRPPGTGVARGPRCRWSTSWMPRRRALSTPCSWLDPAFGACGGTCPMPNALSA